MGESARWGAAAGAAAIALFAIGAVVIGDGVPFDASGAEVAADVAERRTRIQVGAAINALWVPLFLWFLATIASLAREYGPAAGRTGTVALGCGLVFAALFLADVTALAVSALRPESMRSSPELATALRDFEWLAMGMVAPCLAATLAAFGLLALRHRAVLPAWAGRLALVAAALYLLRTGTLFTTDGPFAADGVLGLWLPVAAVAAWTALASVALTVRLSRG